jgi:GNAT superfamily N-acetyltransferase
MVQHSITEIVVRDASLSDVQALSAVRYADQPAIHRDRLRDADGRNLRYLVAHVDETIVGFVLLVFRHPATWGDADSAEYLPGIVDLYVAESWRGRGIGTAIMRHMEELVLCAGHNRLYLGVDPIENPRAYELYLRLGYQPLQTDPYKSHWSFVDSGGYLHEGNEWNIDMVKVLSITPYEEEK